LEESEESLAVQGDTNISTAVERGAENELLIKHKFKVD
jgi:hypothetical protein